MLRVRRAGAYCLHCRAAHSDNLDADHSWILVLVTSYITTSDQVVVSCAFLGRRKTQKPQILIDSDTPAR